MASGRRDGLGALLDRPTPSTWDQFLASPISFLARVVYGWSSSLHAGEVVPNNAITIVCISDTHMSKPDIPDGDILLHAGDLTQSGMKAEIQETVDWLNTLPHQHKIIIAGNHDTFLDSSYSTGQILSASCTPRESIDWGNVTYLENTTVTVESAGRKINVSGSPWSPRHGNWAFQHPRRENVWEDAIPPNIDILITHTPPKAHLDLNWGCDFLLKELWRLPKRPYLHVFGHVHGGYGQHVAIFDSCQLQYESIMKGTTNVAELMGLVYRYLKSRFFSARTISGSRTIMVNASIVGGPRDELRREPAIVYI
ncbi:hypothetical protein FQN49_007379 [Arthroderma sp. PD_2]|nr:hypothetical protein FQN49_007379 [Arthroderma sp. PD_2]